MNEGAEADLEACLKVFKTKAFERRKAQALLVLGQVLEARGKKAESIDRLSHALAQFEGCDDLNGAAYARNRLGQGLLQWRQAGTAGSLVREALAHYESTDNPSGMAWSRMLLGQMAIQEAKYDDAKRHFREGLEGYLTVGNRDGVSWSMNMMGQVAAFRGDFAGAEQMFLEALNIEDEISNHAAQAWTHLNLSETEWQLGRPEKAELHVRKSMEIYGRLKDQNGFASALRGSGMLALGKGDADEAERLFLEAEKASVSSGDPVSHAWHEYQMARVAQERKRFKDAEGLLTSVLSGFEKERYAFGLAWAHHLAAELSLAAGDFPVARERLRRSLTIAKELRLLPVLLEDWLVWASLLAASNDNLDAVEWSEAVLQNPHCSKPTARKATALREGWELKLDADERIFARRAAAAAELDIWTDRILNRRVEPKPPAKPKKAAKKK